MTCLSCADAAAKSAIGVDGKEFVLFAEMEERTLVRENGFEVEGLSCCPSEDGVPGMRRPVLSPSVVNELFDFKLRCGSRFLAFDFDLVVLGLGGNPDLVELGLGNEEMFILVELGNGFSKLLVGICKEEIFGRLEFCVDMIAPLVFSA